jgi:hypothetical protein
MKKIKIDIAEILERSQTERQYQNKEILSKFQKIEENLKSDHERAIVWFAFVESNQVLQSLKYLQHDFRAIDFAVIQSLLQRGILRIYGNIDSSHPRAMAEINV